MNKLEKLREKMIGRDMDALIIHDPLNQLYLSEFSFSDGQLLILRDSAYLITDFRYYEAALEHSNSNFTVVMPSERRDFINDVFVSNNCKTVGLEGDFLPFSIYVNFIKTYPDIKFTEIGDMLSLLRRIKSDDEIVKMQKAQDITDKAFEHILKIITPTMTEIDVATEIDYIMHKFGAEDRAFETIAVSGDLSAVPHGVPRNVRLQKGFLTMDFGAKVSGYCSDMTRTVVIGKADSEMKRLYDTVLSAQLAALDYLKEGADCGEADKIARDIIDNTSGYSGTFGHSLGHSIGLYVHESPGLSRRGFGTTLVSGQVTSVEPGIYIPGKYGCRIEDMVLIKENGIYNFTHSSKDIIEIY